MQGGSLVSATLLLIAATKKATMHTQLRCMTCRNVRSDNKNELKNIRREDRPAGIIAKSNIWDLLRSKMSDRWQNKLSKTFSNITQNKPILLLKHTIARSLKKSLQSQKCPQ